MYNKARHIATVWQKYTDTLVASPSREGYTFLGWYTEPIDGEKISDSEDTTYYAYWQYNG